MKRKGRSDMALWKTLMNQIRPVDFEEWFNDKHKAKAQLEKEKEKGPSLIGSDSTFIFPVSVVGDESSPTKSEGYDQDESPKSAQSEATVLEQMPSSPTDIPVMEEAPKQIMMATSKARSARQPTTDEDAPAGPSRPRKKSKKEGRERKTSSRNRGRRRSPQQPDDLVEQCAEYMHAYMMSNTPQEDSKSDSDGPGSTSDGPGTTVTDNDTVVSIFSDYTGLSTECMALNDLGVRFKLLDISECDRHARHFVNHHFQPDNIRTNASFEPHN